VLCRLCAALPVAVLPLKAHALTPTTAHTNIQQAAGRAPAHDLKLVPTLDVGGEVLEEVVRHNEIQVRVPGHIIVSRVGVIRRHHVLVTGLRQQTSMRRAHRPPISAPKACTARAEFAPFAAQVPLVICWPGALLT